MLAVLLVLIGKVLSFNLDLDSASIFTNSNGFFGYTVLLHSTDSDGLVLVGSPNAKSAGIDVENGGTLFKCSIPPKGTYSDDTLDCDSTVSAINDFGNIYIDEKQTLYIDGDHDHDYAFMIGNRSNQFMGISLAGSDEYVVTCGHKFMFIQNADNEYFDDDLRKQQYIGGCIVLHGDNLDLKEEDWSLATFSPCWDKDQGHERYGNCQAGTSVAIHGSQLLIGAPGLRVAEGGAFSADLTNYVQDFKESPKTLYEQADNPVDDRYLGYSSAICNLDGRTEDPHGLEFVFGGPRADMYKGQVKIFEQPTTSTTVVGHFLPYGSTIDLGNYEYSGEQIGSYFGHSLTCTDINGDGFDDIVVGAPWYTDYDDPSIPSDTGRIYIMYGSLDLTDTDSLDNPDKITGSEPNAAFGFSLAPAGDCNGDGYMDVFVGAPYANDGTGSVFLYLGSASGLSATPSQTITPLDFRISPGIKTFGWSIAGNKDIDGNGYPEVAIGAYASNHVTFIWSKSIIDVIPALTFSYPNFNRTAERRSNTVQVCLKYRARDNGAALDVSSFPVKLTLVLDSAFPVVPRLSFDESTRSATFNKTLTVTTDNSQICTGLVPIWFDQSTKNVKPMTVSLAADIDREEAPGLTMLILNQEIIKDAARDLNITSFCDPTSWICNVDMQVESGKTEFAQSYLYPALVYGYVERFTQHFTVSNLATGPYTYAYNVSTTINLPPSLNFIGVAAGSDVTCVKEGAVEEGEGEVVTCLLPQEGKINSPAAKAQKFGLVIGMKGVTEAATLPIVVSVGTGQESKEADDSNNKITHEVVVKQLADLGIEGGSLPVEVTFNNQYTIVNQLIGSPNVTFRHEYSMFMNDNQENKESVINDINITVWWPNQVPGQPDVFITPLYDIVPKSLDDSRVMCSPLSEVYKDTFQDSTLPLTDEITLPVVSDIDTLPGALDCSGKDRDSVCRKVHCNVERVNRGEAYSTGFKLSLHARVYEANLYDSAGINITSYAELQRNVAKSVLPILRSSSAKTLLVPSVKKSRNLLWIIIVSVICGLLFLFLIILALWKCGFFKRKQPPAVKADKVEEEQWQTYGEGNTLL